MSLLIKRLNALEAKMAQGGIVLTETQLQVLEKREERKEADERIETEHLGYLYDKTPMQIFKIIKD